MFWILTERKRKNLVSLFNHIKIWCLQAHHTHLEKLLAWKLVEPSLNQS